MDTLAHADIFFFVTTICTVVVTALVVIALIFAISIMSHARKMTMRAKEEANKLFAVFYFIRQIFKLI
jgi:hypothetical protein